MADAMEIAELNYETEPYIPQYSSEGWGYINDYNNGNYQSQIQFSTKDVFSKKIIWRDSYVAVPLTVQAASGAAYTNDTRLALKQSVLSLVYGFILNQIGGGNIVSDVNVQFINNLRLMLDQQTDWIDCKAPELQFAIDKVVWAPLHPEYAPSNVGGLGLGQNPGLLRRITFMQMANIGQLPANQTDTSHKFQFMAYLPLRFLHPIFDVANFPMFGSNWELFLQHSFGNNNLYPAFMTDPTPLASAAVASPPVVTIGAILPSGLQTNCRLYYRWVELGPVENLAYQAKLARGFELVREYLSCDTYIQAPGTTATVAGLNGFEITSGVTNPEALTVLLYPAGVVTGAVNLPLAPIGALTNTTIKLGGANCFPDTQLLTSIDYWHLLQKRFVGLDTDTDGAPISYYDFLNAQRIHYFDLSKSAAKLPNKSVSLSITTQRTDTFSCDYVFLVEKRCVVRFNMSMASCTILSGQEPI